MLAAGSLVMGTGAAHAATRSRTPAGFFGVNVDGPVFDDPRVDAATELGRIRGVGLRRVRAVIDWAYAQPDGPDSTDFTRSDALVAEAAAQGIRVLPVVIRTPAWALPPYVGGYGMPPLDPATYAAFMTRLVGRYGPAGTFWDEHPELPRLPIRAWQIWNEPNIPTFWLAQPFAASYVALLKAAAAAVRAADPGAKVVLAGLSSMGLVGGVPVTAPVALSALYAAGARGSFDIVAVHPYVADARAIAPMLRQVRTVLRANGQPNLPMVVSEMAWSSGGGRPGVSWDTTEAGQAQQLTAAFRELARRRVALRLVGAYWYSWLSPQVGQDASWSDYAGLSRMHDGAVTAKPALDGLQTVLRRLVGALRPGRATPVPPARPASASRPASPRRSR